MTAKPRLDQTIAIEIAMRTLANHDKKSYEVLHRYISELEHISLMQSQALAQLEDLLRDEYEAKDLRATFYHKATRLLRKNLING